MSELADELELLMKTADQNGWSGGPVVKLVERLPAILQALRDGEKMRALLADIADSPTVPTAYQWSGNDGLEDMFDPELRHKNGSKPVDYLKAWLSMFRPFAFATKDDSWGELEKLICIVMRNYVRMAAKNARARQTLTGEGQ